MKKLSLHDIELNGKKVLMRVDFNVPISSNGDIIDDTRIRQALPSIEYIISQGASLILMSHFGRPKGKEVKSLSLSHIATHLETLIGQPVKFAESAISEKTKQTAKSLEPKEILLLENLRFHKGEENPNEDPSFAKNLAELADVYVNDAFGTAHRKHSSNYTITEYFPNCSISGFLMGKEISFLTSLLLNPKRPFYAILGGAKISTKIGVLNSLTSKIDGIFIGGGMVFTFFKAQGISIGDSIYNEAFVGSAKSFMDLCQEKAIKLFLPKEIVITNGEEVKTIQIKDGIPDGYKGVDIPEKAIDEWEYFLESAGTIFWNGPMGMFENPEFAKGTNKLAQIQFQQLTH